MRRFAPILEALELKRLCDAAQPPAGLLMPDPTVGPGQPPALVMPDPLDPTSIPPGGLPYLLYPDPTVAPPGSYLPTDPGLT